MRSKRQVFASLSGETTDASNDCPAMDDNNSVAGSDGIDMESNSQGKMVESAFLGLLASPLENAGESKVDAETSNETKEEAAVKKRSMGPFSPQVSPL